MNPTPSPTHPQNNKTKQQQKTNKQTNKQTKNEQTNLQSKTKPVCMVKRFVDIFQLSTKLGKLFYSCQHFPCIVISIIFIRPKHKKTTSNV